MMRSEGAIVALSRQIRMTKFQIRFSVRMTNDQMTNRTRGFNLFRFVIRTFGHLSIPSNFEFRDSNLSSNQIQRISPQRQSFPHAAERFAALLVLLGRGSIVLGLI